ncbi:hypothetical protein [Nonomuraea roseoviolacea]|uniref:WD40 repeat domain-containing protein n=1 Tax=Nonomuraea roseoviolacea subsp. carminata TaxID=160689 RepID=A0ABT1JT00_9ACTN|nr:hypothetical protein [Nonomuraea roseoviolacea]MCP2344562.1 hypothetical protein [Nonomuraea roseoviolacea subsp. carminata]
MTEVEDTLRRTFGQAEEQAPRLPALLAERLVAAHRRRRRRARTALAAAAVVLAAGGVAAVTRGGDTITAVPASQPLSSKPDASVEQVWPRAVLTAPAKGPGGLDWRPAAMIDDRTALMVTVTARGGWAAALYAYDLDSGAQREIVTLPESADGYGLANGFAVGNGQVAWWSSGKDRVAGLWTVPVDGGKPRLVGTRSIKKGDGSGIDVLAVAGDRIVFSLYTGGVFSVPLAGGPVEPVEQGAGMHLLAWPWIGTPGQGGEPHGTEYARILNVETGETRTAVTEPGEQIQICGVTLCFGQGADGRSLVRHRDGSASKVLPGRVALMEPPTQDRFFVSTYGDGGPRGVGLYDVDTGKAGDLGIRGDGQMISLPSTDPSGRLLSYLRGDRLYLIDLSRIR